MIGFSFLSEFVSKLLDEFERDCILGFLIIFSLMEMFKLFGEDGGFDDDDSENGLLYVSFGGKSWDTSGVLVIDEEGGVVSSISTSLVCRIYI